MTGIPSAVLKGKSGETFVTRCEWVKRNLIRVSLVTGRVSYRRLRAIDGLAG
jgi:hypothetical protein